VPCAAFSPDGHFLATACWDGTVRVWDASNARPVTQPLRHPRVVYWVAFSPDGRRLATSCKDQAVRLWDIGTGRLLIPPLPAPRLNDTISRCQFSRDGRWIVTGSEVGARIWDASSGRLRRRFEKQYMGAFSPDGRRLLTWGWASSGSDHTARAWDAATLQPLGPILAHTADVTSAAFSPDGRRAVTLSKGTARLWDPVTGGLLTPPMPYLPGLDGEIAFAPDGRRVLTWSGLSPDVRLWDAATGEPVAPSLNHADHVNAAAFSPDGRWLATGCRDGTVWLWDVSPSERPVSELLLTAQVEAGQRIDATGGSVPLTPRELRRAWHSLRAGRSEATDRSPEQMLAWHRREADLYERTGEWGLALRPLTRLIQARPLDPALRARRADASAALGHWRLAAADFARAIALGSVNVEVWRRLALARLELDDAEGYRQVCNDLLRRFGATQHAETAYRVAWTCALAPGAVAAPNQPVKPAQLAAAYDPHSIPYCTALGAILNRAGRLEESVRRLKEAAALLPPGSAGPHALWLALCEQRLGHPAAARQWLEQSRRYAEQTRAQPSPGTPGVGQAPGWIERLETQLLLREAVTLIRPEAARR
jgi:tetratricopeptide (TPR) repeat protein